MQIKEENLLTLHDIRSELTLWHWEWGGLEVFPLWSELSNSSTLSNLLSPHLKILEERSRRYFSIGVFCAVCLGPWPLEFHVHWKAQKTCHCWHTGCGIREDHWKWHFSWMLDVIGERVPSSFKQRHCNSATLLHDASVQTELFKPDLSRTSTPWLKTGWQCCCRKTKNWLFGRKTYNALKAYNNTGIDNTIR